MTKFRGAVLSAAALGVAVVGATALPSTAQLQPITVQALTGRAVFTDDVDLKIKVKDGGDGAMVINSTSPSRTVVAQITVQPDAEFGWHTHPGPVIVNVKQGELVYVPADDCAPRRYPAGTAFVDPGRGHVHNAFNPTGAETVLVATFFEAPPAPAPLLIPADEPDDCEI